MTQFIDSYIGGEPVHENIFNSLDVIGHDLYLHRNLERTIQSSIDYRDHMRTFIMDLYKINDKKVCEFGMLFLQIYQNETLLHIPIKIADKQALCIKFVNYADMHLPLTLIMLTYDHIIIQQFLNYLHMNAYEINSVVEGEIKRYIFSKKE